MEIHGDASIIMEEVNDKRQSYTNWIHLLPNSMFYKNNIPFIGSYIRAHRHFETDLQNKHQSKALNGKTLQRNSWNNVASSHKMLQILGNFGFARDTVQRKSDLCRTWRFKVFKVNSEFLAKILPNLPFF